MCLRKEWCHCQKTSETRLPDSKGTIYQLNIHALPVVVSNEHHHEGTHLGFQGPWKVLVAARIIYMYKHFRPLKLSGIYFAVAAHNMHACFCPCSCGLHWSPTDPDQVKSSEEHGSHFLPVQEQQSRLRHSSCANRRPALTFGLSPYKAGLLTSG